MEDTPLMVNGVLYTTAGSRRDVVALDAATGELLWVHAEKEGPRGAAAPRQLSGRGLAYWTDGNAGTHYLCHARLPPDFSRRENRNAGRELRPGGVVDLKQDDDQQIDPVTGEVGLHAAPMVAGNTIIVGAAHLNGTAPKSKTNVKGYVRGFDVLTGKRLWIFHTIPKPGEFGYNTWEKDSADYTGNTGVWAQISVDPDLNMAYLPVELPTGDFYGGHRPGNGLFGESIVAVDLKTGQRKWHYQLVHHGLWDMDIPCAPDAGGYHGERPARQGAGAADQTIDALCVQPCHRAADLADRRKTRAARGRAGRVVFAHPADSLQTAGLWAQRLLGGRRDRFHPGAEGRGLQIISKYKIGPLFTPPVVSQTGRTAGNSGHRLLPGRHQLGGRILRSADPHPVCLWQDRDDEPRADGADAGPLRHELRPGSSQFRHRAGACAGGCGSGAVAPGAGGGGAGALTVQGLPLFKPPYGAITAINLDKGEIVWQVPHGETPDNVRNHPALKGLNIPRTGRAGNIGLMTTASLVIAGEPGFITNDKVSAAPTCAPTTKPRAKTRVRSGCRRGRPAHP